MTLTTKPADKVLPPLSEEVSKMLKTPGIYLVTNSSNMFFVEVESDHVCHQLKPHTFERDGELASDGWSGSDGGIFGPLVRPSDALRAADEREAAVRAELGKDKQRLDHLQQRGATVEILFPTTEGSGWRFRIGGRYSAVNTDIRKAIDIARAAGEVKS